MEYLFKCKIKLTEDSVDSITLAFPLSYEEYNNIDNVEIEGYYLNTDDLIFNSGFEFSDGVEYELIEYVKLYFSHYITIKELQEISTFIYDNIDLIYALSPYKKHLSEIFNIIEEGSYSWYPGKRLEDVAEEYLIEWTSDGEFTDFDITNTQRNLLNDLYTSVDLESYSRFWSIEGYIQTPYGVLRMEH